MPESLRDTIARVAREEGLDPAYALAVAERESAFNPNASGTGTIRGLFQMTQASRRGVGQADNASVEDQVRGFARHTKAVQGEMRSVMGRAPTPEETYLGHHFGGVRAGRVVAGHYSGYAPGDVFSPREMAGNPHFGKAASMDQLAGSITGDISRRRAKFGGDGVPSEGGKVDFAQFGYRDGDPDSPERDPNLAPIKDAGTPPPRGPGQPFDFAAFGLPEQETADIRQNPSKSAGQTRPGTEIDLSQYGQPMPPMPPSVQAFAPQAMRFAGDAPAGQPDDGGAEGPGAYTSFQNFPESTNVVDNRNLPESEKPAPVSTMMDAFDRQYRPYTAGTTYPSHERRRSTPLARDAGIDSIPSLGNKVDPNSDLYPDEQKIDPRWKQFAVPGVI